MDGHNIPEGKSGDLHGIYFLQYFFFATSGTLLEKGNAVQQTNWIDWIYTPTQANAALAGSEINAYEINNLNTSSQI